MSSHFEIMTPGVANRSIKLKAFQTSGGANPGDLLTGLTFSGLTLNYRRGGGGPVNSSIMVTGGTEQGHINNAIYEYTEEPGSYKIDLPDVATGTGEESVEVWITDTTGSGPLQNGEFETAHIALVTQFDPANDIVDQVNTVNNAVTPTNAAQQTQIASDTAAILVDTGTTIPGLIGALNDVSTADLLVQARAALDEAGAELTGDPGAAPSVRAGVQALIHALRHRRTFNRTGGIDQIRNSAGTVILTSTGATDDGTTFDRPAHV